MSDIQIVSLQAEMVSAAALMLADAFVTNPLHVAAFGAGALAKNQAFFRIGLSVMKGPKLVAISDSRIAGAIHWVDSPACQFSGFEKLRMTPAMIRWFGLHSAMRVGSWLSGWSKHDLPEPHSHLGPIGVAPEEQGRRIGHQLMERYCEQLDSSGRPGYLETDRPENVAFYQRFGFNTIEQFAVLGVQNYFMTRPVKSGD
jgi:ribosomal protein S18 acetylase RimI-like enzyme